MSQDYGVLKKRLARNIAMVRKARGVSQAALATRVAADRHAIAEMERGKATVPAITLFEIARALDADIRWFLVDTTLKLNRLDSAAITPALELKTMQLMIEEEEIRDLWRFMRFAEFAKTEATDNRERPH